MSTAPEEDIRVYIERLKVALGVRSDEQLGVKLGVSKQTIASWRRRGKLPLDAETRIVDAFGPGLAYSSALRHIAGLREDETVYAVALMAYEQFIGSLDAPPDLRMRRALGYLFPKVVETVRREVRNSGFELENSLTMIEIFSAVLRAGKLPAVTQILQRSLPSETDGIA